MEKLKVSEIFYSIQGEGRYMGVPSVFLRTFGCNFKCAGFGMPKGQLTTEPDEVAKNIHLYKSYEELPLVENGCDSYATWHPAMKHLSPFMNLDDVANKVVDTLPYKEWRDEHLVITGGEPLLKWQNLYPELLTHPRMRSLKELTFETNGTQALTPEFKTWLHREWHHDGTIGFGRGHDSITFSVSAKLSCSGEPRERAIRPSVVCEYEEYGYTYLKFVISTEEDAEEAEETVDIYRAEGFQGPVYLMPVGGVENIYSLNNKRVAELAMKLGYRYSDRLQVPLFKNAWGT
jgi:organic radical activating enzyme